MRLIQDFKICFELEFILNIIQNKIELRVPNIDLRMTTIKLRPKSACFKFSKFVLSSNSFLILSKIRLI